MTIAPYNPKADAIRKEWLGQTKAERLAERSGAPKVDNRDARLAELREVAKRANRSRGIRRAVFSGLVSCAAFTAIVAIIVAA